MEEHDPLIAALEIMSTKQRWDIIRCIMMGHTRFNQIKKECGMSSAALARTLRHFQDSGLIIRKVNGGKVPDTEYSLTNVGHGFAKVVDAMAKWGKRIG
jgi:DNA-binding HxlR family transcriptional regulator